MLAQGHNLRLRDEGGGRGRSSTQNKKNQDSQHMLRMKPQIFAENHRMLQKPVLPKCFLLFKFLPYAENAEGPL